IKDEQGACRGIAALDLRTMEIEAFAADAVCLATGGPGIVYGRSTNSTINTGSANGRSYIDGAIYANAEFVQVHPTAIPGEDKHRLMSESARGEGGRVWVPKQKGDKRRGKDIPENERWYFLEEKYPRYGNLVPRDVGSREIFAVVKDLGMGVEGQDAVYLDVSHIPAANRLGANSLLSCIYAGMIAGPAMISYARNNMKAKGDVPGSLLAAGKKQWDERFNAIYRMSGPENPYVIGQQMGDLMIKSATV